MRVSRNRTPFALIAFALLAAFFASPRAGAAQEEPTEPPAPPADTVEVRDAAPDTAAADTTKADDPIARYREVIPDSAVSDPGLFLVHRVGEDYFFELPLDLLGRDLLFQTRITQAPTGAGFGGELESSAVTRFERRSNRIYLRMVGHENFAADTLPIREAVLSSNFTPILYSFVIKAFTPDSTAVVIDAGAFFRSDSPIIAISQARRDAYQVLGYSGDRSYIASIRSFPENVEVRRVATYSANRPPSFQTGGTLSLELGHSFLLLPADPMPVREWDERVGFFNVRQFDYGAETPTLLERHFIRRWRLEPSDPDAYARGELVAPVRPIVLYLDPATPERWRPYIKQGIEDWQAAFEAAGFRDAIVAKDPPTAEEDPEFDPADVRYSIVRYFASSVQNASGPSFFDPRTGEILGTHVEWHHNITTTLRNWFLIQTGAANPAARTLDLPEEILGELIRYVAAHEVGHTLGLQHNRKAHSAVPVERLRTRWVCENGTSASIMDYARFNYVAQPGDDTCFIPRIGPYDRWAIEWGYRVVPGANSSEEETAVLRRWLSERSDNPLLRFGDVTDSDPTAMMEALGDDPVRASDYGILNLQRVMRGIRDWTYEEGKSYDDLRETYMEVLRQWNRYAAHVAAVIGGVEWVRRVQGDDGRPYLPISADRQRAALDYLDREVFRTPRWMIDPDILLRIEDTGLQDRMSTIQVGILSQVLDTPRMKRMIEQEVVGTPDNYPLAQMLADLRAAVWRGVENPEETDPLRRSLQRGYIERMGYLIDAVDTRSTDIAPLARGELRLLDAELAAAEERASDAMALVHIEDIRSRIEQILTRGR